MQRARAMCLDVFGTMTMHGYAPLIMEVYMQLPAIMSLVSWPCMGRVANTTRVVRSPCSMKLLVPRPCKGIEHD